MSKHLELQVADVPKLIEAGAVIAAERVLNKLVERYGNGDVNLGFGYVWTQGSLVGLTLAELARKAQINIIGEISTGVAWSTPGRLKVSQLFEESDHCSTCVATYAELEGLASPFFLVAPDDLLTAKARTEAWFQDWLTIGV